MIIYKITNLINNKIYIGLTTLSLNKRWTSHKAECKRNNKKHLYNAMRKYGIESFKIEEIDNTDDIIKLGELERYYIKFYDSRNPEKGYNITAGGERNQLDANPRATLSVEEVIQIRNIYDSCELNCKQCWEMYKNKISFSAFQKIWEGTTWKNVNTEVYTEENINWHKKQTGLEGERNPIALYKDWEILEIRKYYVNHSLTECYNKFGFKSKSKCAFRNLIDRGYLNVPRYLKNEKKWTFKGEEIDINNYKPVSTISVSGE